MRKDRRKCVTDLFDTGSSCCCLIGLLKHLIQVNNLEKYDTAYAGDPFAFLFSSMQFTFKKEFLMSIIKLKFILYIDQGNHKPNSQRQGTQEIEDQV